MAKITCPACKTDIVISVGRIPAGPPIPPMRKKTEVSALNNGSLRLVFDFMKQLEPGSYLNQDLYAKYSRFVGELGRLPLSPQGLSKALVRQGAERWRTARARGFHIDAFPEGAKPILLPYSTSERQEADLQRAWVQQNRIDTAKPAEKPFDPLDFTELPG